MLISIESIGAILLITTKKKFIFKKKKKDAFIMEANGAIFYKDLKAEM